MNAGKKQWNVCMSRQIRSGIVDGAKVIHIQITDLISWIEKSYAGNAGMMRWEGIMTSEEREYFSSGKSLRKRLKDNDREYEEEQKYEQCDSSNHTGKRKGIL